MTETRKRSGSWAPSVSKNSSQQTPFENNRTQNVDLELSRRYVTAPTAVLGKLSPLHQHRLTLLLLSLPIVEDDQTKLTATWFGGSYRGRCTLAELWGCTVGAVTETVTTLREAGVSLTLSNDANRFDRLDLVVPLGKDRRAQLPLELAGCTTAAVPVWVALSTRGPQQTNRVLCEALGLGRNKVREALRSLEAAGLRDRETGMLNPVRRTLKPEKMGRVRNRDTSRQKPAPAEEETVEQLTSANAALNQNAVGESSAGNEAAAATRQATVLAANLSWEQTASPRDETPRRIQALIDKGWSEHGIRDALDNRHSLGSLAESRNPPGALLHRLRNLEHEQPLPPKPTRRRREYEPTTPEREANRARLAEVLVTIGGGPR